MKIYTKGGDKGTTSLVGGTRVPKDDPRLDAYGTVDELNSWIGVLYSTPGLPDGQADVLLDVMSRLFDIGAALATEAASSWQPAPFPAGYALRLEAEIDRMEAELPAHKSFILPAGCSLAAYCNVARTVARRAERRIVALGGVQPEILQFVNRLSDYLFVLGRAANLAAGCPEVLWKSLKDK